MRRERFIFVEKPPKPPGSGAWVLQLLIVALALLSFGAYLYFFPSPPET